MSKLASFSLALYAIATGNTIHAATITDFNTWSLVEDPPNANLSASIDSSNQVTLNANGSVPNAADIGFQSVDGNTPASSSSGFAFDPSNSFSLAIDYDWTFQNAVGGSAIGFGIGEDGAGAQSAGVSLVASGPTILVAGVAARTSQSETNIPLISPGSPSPTGSMHMSYDAITGDIVAGIGATGAGSPLLAGTLTGASIYELLNSDADSDLLLVSFFIRSQDLGLVGPPLSSGTSTAVFSNFRVVSGNPVAIPEPTLLGLSVLAGIGFIARRGRI
ncbi:MAG: hypothetical protein AAF745_18155 [Planctomycetota bacterium]